MIKKYRVYIESYRNLDENDDTVILTRWGSDEYETELEAIVDVEKYDLKSVFTILPIYYKG